MGRRRMWTKLQIRRKQTRPMKKSTIFFKWKSDSFIISFNGIKIAKRKEIKEINHLVFLL